jgi:hypothetical protein
MSIKIPGTTALGGGGLNIPSSPSGGRTQYDPLKQAAGYTRRLEEGLGVDVEKEVDDRNIIGRTLNLRKNQNFFLDLFEVIGRPQQAIFAALEAGAKGQDAFRAMEKGLKGEKYTRFKNVLKAYGMEESESKRWEAADVLGFLGDVFLDPVNLALIPTGAPIAKGALTAKKATSISKNAAQAGQVVKAAKEKGTVLSNIINTADDIANVTRKGIEAKKTIGQVLQGKGKVSSEVFSNALLDLQNYDELGKLVNTVLEGQQYTKLTSPLGFVGKQVKQGLGATLQFTDSQIGNVLKKIDIANGVVFNNPDIKSLKDLMGTIKPANVPSLLENYYDLKNTVLATFDIARVIPAQVLDKIRESTGRFDVTKGTLDRKFQTIMKSLDEYWGSLKNLTDDTGNVFFKSKDEFKAFMQRSIEYKYKYDPKLMGQVTVDEVLSNKGHRLTQSAFDTLNDIAQRSGIGDLTTGSVGKGVIKQTDAAGNTTFRLADDLRNKLLAAIGEGNDKVLNTLLDRANFYDKEMIDTLETLLKNPEFSNLVEEVATELETFQKAVSEFQKQAKIQGFSEKGYIRHVYNQEFEALRRVPEIQGDLDQFLPPLSDKINIGNVQAIAERQFKMSAYEANRVMDDFLRETLQRVDLSDESRRLIQSVQGKEIFRESIEASVSDWLQEIPKLVKQASQIDEILIKSSIRIDEAGTSIINDSKDVFILNYTGADLPPGYITYDHPTLLNQLKKLSKVIDSKEMNGVISYLEGLTSPGKAAIDKNVFEMIKALSKIDEVGFLVKTVEAANNLFRKTKLLSPGFQLRNIVGNSSNMFLVGMPLNKIPRYTAKADRILKRVPDIGDKVITNGIASLTADEAEIFKLFTRFYEGGFMNSAEAIYDVTDAAKELGPIARRIPGAEVADWMLRFNNTVNEAMDARFRLALLMYADETPSILNNLGVSSSEDVVRRALFDPKAISPLERKYIKRLIPFYTFAKKNLAFQMKNILDNPVRYNMLQKGISSFWSIEGIEWQDIEDYKRENMWIPMPGLTKGGKYTAVKMNLPVGDLGEFLDTPLRKVVSILGPAVRVPFELATGTQIFTQRPIEDFPGQRGYNFDFLTRRQEYLLSQTGLDVPLSTAQGLVRGAAGIAGLDRNQMSLGQAVPSVFSEGDVARAQRSEAYDYLKQVTDLYRYYKQEAGEVPTIAEIENRNPGFQILKQRMNGLKIPR